VREFFALFDFANLTFLPNFFSSAVSEKGDASSAFEDEDMSNNFLLNCGHIVTAWIILANVVIFAFVAVYLVRRLRKFWPGFFHNAPIRLVLVGFTYCSLGIWL
jgi:hypothetical protein